MDNQHLSELIGLIYDVAHDVAVWPRLLELLSEEIDSLHREENSEQPIRMDGIDIELINANNSTVALSTEGDADRFRQNPTSESSVSEYALIHLLRSHFTRALKLNRRIHEALEERNALEDALGNLLERLPLGIVIVDSESRVLAYNRKLYKSMSEGKGISIHDGVLCARLPTDTVRLKRLIRSVADGKEKSTEAIDLSDPESTTPLSILIIPFRTKPDTRSFGDKKVIVMIATPKFYLEIPTEPLMSLYKLTAAEAKLVSALVRDESLNSIAEQFGISKHTIRSQLKSVYEKTDTHRQAELVRQVITGPAMLAAISGRGECADNFRVTPIKLSKFAKGASTHHRSVRLPDNRLLGYAEYGLPDGRPLILMHATIGSRLQRHPDESIVERIGIRLIVPDRPGVGLSDNKENMSLLDWANDIEHLAEHLKLKRFAVLGYSGGGAFALACAHRLQKTIDRVILVSSIAPFHSIWELDGMIAPFRLVLSLGKYAPSLLGPLVRLTGIRRRPELFSNEFIKQMPEIDKILLNDAAIRKRIDEDMRENLRQGDRHIQREVLLMSRDWEFKLNDIQLPVELWHGEQDPIAPAPMVTRLTEALPNCRTNWVPNAGHHLLYSKWEEILRSAM